MVLSIALSLLLHAAPPPAPLFTPGEVESRHFKEAFERGEALFKEADYGAAVANFRLADRARVTPEVAYDLAKCHEKLGDLAFTVYYYRLYMRRAPSAPDTLDVAERVGNALAKAEAENRGFLEIDAPRALSLTVANRAFVEGPVAIFLPPGDYEINAVFPAGPKKMRVQVKTGRAASVVFEPMQPPMVAVERALSPEVLALGKSGEPTPSASGLRVASYVVAGAGLAALAAGIALGVLSKQDGTASMDRSHTLSQAKDLANAANGKAVAANVLFGVGGAAVAGGVVMFIFSMPEPGMKASTP